MVKLIALDMDGTALNSQSLMSEKTQNAIRNKIKEGVLIVPCTGRAVSSIPSQMLELDVNYAICADGSVVRDMRLQKDIRRSTLCFEQTAQVIRFFRKYETIIYFVHDGIYDFDERNAEKYSQIYQHHTIDDAIEDLAKAVEENGWDAEKIVVVFLSLEEKQKAIQEAQALFPVRIMSTGVRNIEIISSTTSKGMALKWLMERLGLKKEEVMAVGDSENDIELLRAAGLAVAMGNALQQVKDAADFVTLSNDEDGAAYALEHLLPQYLERKD